MYIYIFIITIIICFFLNSKFNSVLHIYPLLTSIDIFNLRQLTTSLHLITAYVA